MLSPVYKEESIDHCLLLELYCSFKYHPLEAQLIINTNDTHCIAYKANLIINK